MFYRSRTSPRSIFSHYNEFATFSCCVPLQWPRESSSNVLQLRYYADDPVYRVLPSLSVATPSAPASNNSFTAPAATNPCIANAATPAGRRGSSPSANANRYRTVGGVGILWTHVDLCNKDSWHPRCDLPSAATHLGPAKVARIGTMDWTPGGHQRTTQVVGRVRGLRLHRSAGRGCQRGPRSVGQGRLARRRTGQKPMATPLWAQDRMCVPGWQWSGLRICRSRP